MRTYIFTNIMATGVARQAAMAMIRARKKTPREAIMAQAAGTYEQATRAARLAEVADIYGDPSTGTNDFPEPGDIPRFVGVQSDGNQAPWYYLGDKIEDIERDLSDMDGGWNPEAIVDLDTGDRYDIEIVVRRGTRHPAVIEHGLDTASSASRQHFIDTGRYLTLAERADDMLDSLSAETYGLVTRTAEREHGIGATALAEDHPADCIALIERITSERAS